MSYLKTSTGDYPLSADDIKKSYPNTSFPGDLAGFEVCIARLGYVKVAEVQPPFIDHTQNIREVAPIESEEGYKQGWLIENASPAEIAARTAEQAGQMREERNRRLADCDWTQLSDSPVSATGWGLYRQALRDVPLQDGFPWAVQWPASPA